MRIRMDLPDRLNLVSINSIGTITLYDDKENLILVATQGATKIEVVLTKLQANFLHARINKFFRENA